MGYRPGMTWLRKLLESRAAVAAIASAALALAAAVLLLGGKDGASLGVTVVAAVLAFVGLVGAAVQEIGRRYGHTD